MVLQILQLIFIFIICLLIIILINSAVNKIIVEIHNRTIISKNRYLSSVKLNNNTIEILDNIISEILEEYTILQLKPKDIIYISNSIENEIREYVVNEVSKRISNTVMDKLALIYDVNYIPELIGTRVYLAVVNYSLDININSEEKK